MKAVILAGGFGTRIAEETTTRPKPMVEIGGHPILWHIMKAYAAQGFKEFVIALGYKGETVKDYFLNYHLRTSSLSVRLSTGESIIRGGEREDWLIHLLDTGDRTQTGGRIRRAAQFIGREPFAATYGDGVSDVDLRALLSFHKAHGKLATVTAVRPPARFGGLTFDGDFVAEFVEKPQIGEGWINGGFFVFEPGIVDYLTGDECILEREPLERLAVERQLVAYRHEGFWQCMDTMRDLQLLNNLWQGGHAPWKVW